MSDLELDVEPLQEEGTGLLVTVHGRIDSRTVPVFQERLEKIKNRERNNILLLDLGDVDYINSTGLGALVKLSDRIDNEGGTLALADLQEGVRVPMESLGVDAFFDLFPSVEEARDHLGVEEPEEPEVEPADEQPEPVEEEPELIEEDELVETLESDEEGDPADTVEIEEPVVGEPVEEGATSEPEDADDVITFDGEESPAEEEPVETADSSATADEVSESSGDPDAEPAPEDLDVEEVMTEEESEQEEEEVLEDVDETDEQPAKIELESEPETDEKAEKSETGESVEEETEQPPEPEPDTVVTNWEPGQTVSCRTCGVKLELGKEKGDFMCPNCSTLLSIADGKLQFFAPDGAPPISMTVNCRPESKAGLAAFLTTLAGERGLPEQEVRRLKQVVESGTSLIYRKAYQKNRNGTFRVLVQFEDSNIRVRFADHGNTIGEENGEVETLREITDHLQITENPEGGNILSVGLKH